MDFTHAGKTLRRTRKEQGLTQEVLGEMIGASPVTISRIERGVIVPSVPMLIALCNALNIGADAVLAAYVHAVSPTRWTPIVQRLEELDAEKKSKAEAMIESILDNI